MNSKSSEILQMADKQLLLPLTTETSRDDSVRATLLLSNSEIIMLYRYQGNEDSTVPSSHFSPSTVLHSSPPQT